MINKTNDIVIITRSDPIDAPYGPEIVWVNEAFLKVTKYTINEVVGKTPRILQGKETSKDTLLQIKNAIKKQNNINVELLNYDKYGVPYWINFSIIYIHDDQGKLCYLGAIERDITDIKNLNLKLSEKVITDPLTQVFNRESFYVSGSEALKHFKQYNEAVGLLFFDIDNFKSFNDTYGHIAGDKLLQSVAQAAQKLVRQTDKVYRYGGDEFAIIFSGINKQSLQIKAEELITALAKQKISISVGGSLSKLSDTTIEEIVERADFGLYKIKRARKGSICIV
ncbi:diguanylate cyclase [Legionella moravica]|uniref:diguanylate cyclase n=1 Tax=Legionella moravica TaxID=39962 RepID=UPI001F5F8556|nr:diguanylate cyclase [Legionella moravica]